VFRAGNVVFLLAVVVDMMLCGVNSTSFKYYFLEKLAWYGFAFYICGWESGRIDVSRCGITV
jgi:hypothetical protein